MRLRSFTIVAIRLIGLILILYGIITIIFMLMTIFMFSGMAGAAFSEMGSVIWIQFLLPGLIIVFGVILMAASNSLGEQISSGLED